MAFNTKPWWSSHPWLGWLCLQKGGVSQWNVRDFISSFKVIDILRTQQFTIVHQLFNLSTVILFSLTTYQPTVDGCEIRKKKRRKDGWNPSKIMGLDRTTYRLVQDQPSTTERVVPIQNQMFTTDQDFATIHSMKPTNFAALRFGGGAVLRFQKDEPEQVRFRVFDRGDVLIRNLSIWWSLAIKKQNVSLQYCFIIFIIIIIIMIIISIVVI